MVLWFAPAWGQNNEGIDEVTAYTGSWKLTAISGGFSGMGEKIKFPTVLEVYEDGMYSISQNGIQVEKGDFVVKKSFLGTKVTLEPTKSSLVQVFTKETKTIYQEENKLFLMDPCCDMFTYHFEQIK